MEVIVAKTAGFCFGVQRAVDKVYSSLDKEQVYTYGPIIHNEEVVNDLKLRGVSVIDDSMDNLKKGTVVIRAHGATKAEFEKLESMGMTVEDATCPFVSKIYRIVREESDLGRTVVIVGNASHPEVVGIRGWTDKETYVISDVSEAMTFDIDATEISIVAQTTYNFKKFQEIVEIITKKGYDIRCLNTICNATEVRQTEAREIASSVDAMIVIGGKNSSNTQKLFEICKENCSKTFFIQTADDLELEFIRGVNKIGITAGASTPKNIIEEVQTKCQN